MQHGPNLIEDANGTITMYPSSDVARADGRAIAWLLAVLSLPQAYGAWRRTVEGRQLSKEC